MADVIAENPVQKSEADATTVDGSDTKTADSGDVKPKIYQRLSFIERWEKRIEHLKSLPRDEEGLTGKVRFYSLSNRFGFIERDDNKESIYFHQASITASKEAQQPWFRTVNDGAAVKFDVVKTERGLEAVNLHSPGDEPLDEHEKFGLQFILTRIRAHRRAQAALKGNNNEDDEKAKTKKSPKKAGVKKEAVDGDDKNEKDEKKPKKKLRERKPKSEKPEEKKDEKPEDGKKSEEDKKPEQDVPKPSGDSS